MEIPHPIEVRDDDREDASQSLSVDLTHVASSSGTAKRVDVFGERIETVLKDLNIHIEKETVKDGESVARNEDVIVEPRADTVVPESTVEPIETDIEATIEQTFSPSHMDDTEEDLEDLEDLSDDSSEFELVIRHPPLEPKPTV